MVAQPPRLRPPEAAAVLAAADTVARGVGSMGSKGRAMVFMVVLS